MNIGPQFTVTAGIQENPGAKHIGSWTGLTIKEILEKVDLSNIIIDDDDKKEKIEKAGMVTEIDPESAYLGPKLWSRSIPIPLTGDNDDFAVMNIDDFLSENGFECNEAPSSPDGLASPRSTSSEMDMDMESTTVEIVKKSAQKRSLSPTKKSNNDDDNSFLYVESKRARLEREREEKRRRQQEIEFSAQDLALATVPGMEFDPRERSFAPDELRPQPIIRKRKKSFVPSEHKDGKYWEKREKNNVAARRSREARRLKENQIALRTAFLEKENAALKSQVDEVKAENMELVAEKQILLEKLKKYES